MTWDAISAVAELIGALAVLISILYLAIQVRQTRKQLEAQAGDNLTSKAFEAYAPIYEGDNWRIFYKGLSAPETLAPDEALLFKLMMDRQRGAFATLVRNTLDKSVPSEVSQGMLQSYRELFANTAGGRHWLAQHQQVLSKEERSLLNVEQE